MPTKNPPDLPKDPPKKNGKVYEGEERREERKKSPWEVPDTYFQELTDEEIMKLSGADEQPFISHANHTNQNISIPVVVMEIRHFFPWKVFVGGFIAALVGLVMLSTYALSQEALPTPPPSIQQSNLWRASVTVQVNGKLGSFHYDKLWTTKEDCEKAILVGGDMGFFEALLELVHGILEQDKNAKITLPYCEPTYEGEKA